MSSTEKGDKLELAVFDLLNGEIEADRFTVRKEYCRIFSKKGYFSRDRDSDIFFDISIEVWEPGADRYSILFLIECKNYNHAVPVNDVEEFYTKAIQVSATGVKPIVVASGALQSGALKFCKSKNMGVARYFPHEDLKWELRRSASTSIVSSESQIESEILEGLTVPGYQSAVFELFMQSPRRKTNSLADFFEDMVLEGSEGKPELRELLRPPYIWSGNVEFISADHIEHLAMTALCDSGISPGYVDLTKVCTQLPALQGVSIEYKSALPATCYSATLARISFQPPLIEIYTDPNSTRGRDRFTLAHELGHFLLGHGKYLKGERYAESDQNNAARGFDSDNDIKRMEYQANYFAACILMPKEVFLMAFKKLLSLLEVRGHGSGGIYVDEQQCNIETYFSVTDSLMSAFGVSRAAVHIRLASLGLLHDAR